MDRPRSVRSSADLSDMRDRCGYNLLLVSNIGFVEDLELKSNLMHSLSNPKVILPRVQGELGALTSHLITSLILRLPCTDLF